MVLNGMDESSVTKHLTKATMSEEFSMVGQSKDQLLSKMPNTNSVTAEKLLDNAFVSEMALRNIKDFKTRSRTNMVPRVAKRIDREERRTKDLQSTISSVHGGSVLKKRHKANKSITTEKVMSY